MTDSNSLDAIRQAVELAPENVALRIHLAKTLLASGFHSEAESHFKTALKADPTNESATLGLAKSFEAQGKNSEAFVVLEGATPTPNVNVLKARLALKAGEPEAAVKHYRDALDESADAFDEDLSEQLGVYPRSESTDDEDDEFMDGEIVDGRIRMMEGGGDFSSPAEIERPKLKFDDVGGMEAVKNKIRMKIIHPLANKDLFAAYGKSVGGGLLLYGPPGCGKTHLARATAGEVQASFLSIGIHEVVEMWIGKSEQNLHEIFAQARRTAPCVLFFDEVDALGARRSDMRGSAGRHVINQFLSELDGDKYDNDGVLILAATNAPWHVDSAFRRPGRFDEQVFVPPPDEEARFGIFDVLLRGKPQESIDRKALSQKSKGLSGADIKGVVDKAIEAKLEEAIASGIPQPLKTKDLLKALKKTKATTKEWLATARNYALHANEGGAYDEILDYLEGRY